ncbi:hypothetical protein Cpir12675_000300 [Ceratocystis pirilliformis]|uniref:Uncharacterized protein n=3 Tax=Ceratocystis TaxID=5157 RepID=A0A2C5X422_9PEZI|nr:hypothetical protein CFIMG_003370RAa [Ceratocystis fimbriata CBS 114723]
MATNPSSNSARIEPECCDQLLQELSTVAETDRSRSDGPTSSTAPGTVSAAQGATNQSASSANINQPFINDIINGAMSDILGSSSGPSS